MIPEDGYWERAVGRHILGVFKAMENDRNTFSFRGCVHTRSVGTPRSSSFPFSSKYL